MEKWFPQLGEKFFYITNDFDLTEGAMAVIETTREDTEIDESLVKNGNCFKDKKEASNKLKQIDLLFS